MTTTSLKAVYIQNRNSGLVLEYQPDATYEVVMEKTKSPSTDTQQWFVIDSGVAGYVYIQSKYDKKVITAGDNKKDHLVVSPMKYSLDLNQV